MLIVFRYAGGLCVALALVCAGAAAGHAAPVPSGPRLAFTAMSSLQRSGMTVRTVGTETAKALVIVRGSRRGVVPRPRDGLAWSPDGNRLAFTGSQGTRNGIYTMQVDGSDLRFLRGTRGGMNPVFSPDGRLVAFSRERLGKGLFFGSTPWVANANGGSSRRLAGWHEGVEYVPSSFSPDGSTLAVTRRRAFESERSTALLLTLDGDGRRRLARFPASEPVYSPDGSQIAFVRNSLTHRGRIESSHSDLYVVDASGTAPRQLTSTPWIAETHPSWDPSGERIAFDSFRISRDPLEALFDQLLPFGNSIVQVNADGTCREKLISLPDAATFAATWQPGEGREAGRIECVAEPVSSRVPTGPRLAFMSFDLWSFRFELKTVGEAGANSLLVAGGGEGKRPLPWFEAPTWSPDGSQIVFTGVARRLFGGPRRIRLYVSDADGRDLHPLRGTYGGEEPVFAPGGATVAFTRYWFEPRRSRDGRDRFVSGGSSIWLVDLAGGRPRRITPLRKGLYLYPNSFSPDGATLLATREIGTRPSQAVALTLATGRSETVVRHAFDPIYSPNGRRIAFVRTRILRRGNGDDDTTTDLFTVKAHGGGLRRLTSGREDDLFQSWDPSGRRIAFVRYRPEVTERDEIGLGSTVMEVNADGSCLHSVLKPSPNTGFYGAVWQPGPGRDAGRIAC